MLLLLVVRLARLHRLQHEGLLRGGGGGRRLRGRGWSAASHPRGFSPPHFVFVFASARVQSSHPPGWVRALAPARPPVSFVRPPLGGPAAVAGPPPPLHACSGGGLCCGVRGLWGGWVCSGGFGTVRIGFFVRGVGAAVYGVAAEPSHPPSGDPPSRGRSRLANLPVAFFAWRAGSPGRRARGCVPQHRGLLAPLPCVGFGRVGGGQTCRGTGLSMFACGGRFARGNEFVQRACVCESHRVLPQVPVSQGGLRL